MMDGWNGLYWRESGWLWLMLAPGLLWLLNHWLQRQQWQKIADRHLLPWLQARPATARQRLRPIGLLGAWILFCIALAGPRSISYIPPDQRPEPAEVAFVIDVSASMNANDLRPTRRSMSGEIIRQWISQDTAPHKYSAMLFAGHAFELLPPTIDSQIALDFLQALDDIRLPTLGNNLPAALRKIEQRWSSDTDDATPKRLFLFSDGDIETSMIQPSSDALRALAARPNTRLYLIGMADNKPVVATDFNGQAMRHQERPVLTRLQAGWMKTLSAGQQSIEYAPYRDIRNQSLSALLDIPPMQIDPDNRQRIVWHEWFPPFVLGGMLLFLASLMPGRAISKASVLLPLVLLSWLLQTTPLQADAKEDLQAASQAMAQQQYQVAVRLSEQLDGYDAHFIHASACYRLQDYPCAIQFFTRAIQQTENRSQQAVAIFNLGNSFFFSGDYDQAAVLYRDAGLHGIDPAQVKTNLAFAEDLQAALQRHLQDIRETLRRARWRAAASGDIPPQLEDLLAVNRDLLLPRGDARQQARFYRHIEQTYQQQLNKLLEIADSADEDTARDWVKTTSRQASTRAQLMNRLFEMESGIYAPLQQARPIEGMRTW